MQTKDLVLGLDVGTGSAKCVVASPDGHALWSASASYEWRQPQPGWAEQDPDEWWEAGTSAIRQVLGEHPEARDRIAAISVCGQGAAAVVVDRRNRPVRPAILWLDSRSAPQSRELSVRAGDSIAAVSGKRPAAYNAEPKLLWIREHEPDIWARTAAFMTTTGYITYRLCGSPVMNHSDAGILLSYDLGRHTWSSELSELMGIPAEMYCTLAECDEVIGAVTAAAAQQTGLEKGTPVVAGGEDTSSAALAIGVTHRELGLLSLGTAGTIYTCNDRPITHPRLLAFPHVLRDLTLVGGSTVCGGSGLEWICRVLGRNTVNGLNDLCAEADASSVQTSRLIFLPYLSGELQPLNDGFARGVFFGADFSTNAVDMVKAVMQGTAFAFAHNLELAQEIGVAVSALAAVGRPARNAVFIQTVSDATGLPIRVMDESGGAALGAAILGATGTGLVRSAGEMATAHARVIMEVAPNADAKARLGELFGIYKELYPRLQDLFPRLHSIQLPLEGKEAS